ncbi:MAG: type II toxin-antitoxin system HicB family antitoxin [Alphaproteobacteria bacterium]|nr:type II toxin-antitoxin system HicB family antitoxin [Alphaproteobacteria bacterium]
MRSFDLAWPVRLSTRDGAVVVDFPDFDEDHRSWADDRLAALAEAEDLLAVLVGHRLESGRSLPAPSKPGRRPVVRLPVVMAAKTRLHQAFARTGLDKAALARRMGKAPQQMARLFSPRHNSRIEELEAALAALGKCLVVEVRDAA